MGLSRGVDEFGTIERIDAFCDAVPRRRARAEELGPLVLFVPVGAGWPYYARPRLGRDRTGGPAISPGDIRAVRARQRELLIPESFEWIDEAAPQMTAAAPAAGLAVRAHPLMVLGTLTAPSVTEPGPSEPALSVRIVSPDEPDLDRVWAVPAVAFEHPGTATGLAGAIERDKIASGHDEGVLTMLRERLRSGQSVLAAAFDQDGPLGAGSCQSLASVAEITGVGVLPAARRMGLGGAVTAALAADAQRRGVQTVFLAASDDDVARVYRRLGFRRIGTAMIAEPDGVS
ncbi:MAG TPA: GNAT family N-acetyltransferase [Streptosporangiaceae bacterium]|nr:GNAT family N-acetyltransferase [Streptosporangiaceae bacterium]